MGKEINMNPSDGQAQVQISPSDLTDVLCEKCDNQTFELVFLFKKLSAILSPSGKETLVPLQVYSCAKCSHINEGFLPKEDPNA
jgi:hypothetical protein|tara:strand:+ start:51 stop:302 length:252 start_codon:yes stop_codon:yes gene_type:complete